MASKLITLCTTSLLLLLLCSPSLANYSFSSIFNTPETICENTRFPHFCKSSLPHNKPGTIHDYAKISFQQSLSHAQRFLWLVQHYSRLPSTLYKSTILALEDCLFLAQENIDYLSYVMETLKSSADDALQGYQAEDLQTLLSATLTNQETCLDGLQYRSSSSSIKNALLVPISNGTMHYSVALALFTRGWAHSTMKGRYLTERKHVFSDLEDGASKGLPLMMSSKDKQIYESVSGRRVLKTSNLTGVLVSKVVVVDPYGSGKFRTITEAVAAAPNNTFASNGYYVIYVVAGVYKEYVSIPKSKKYLMMIGAGINQTVITGNRSVDDGWTTFNSATFAVLGQGFVAVNITFRNTAEAIKHQAVAVRSGADMSTFYKCSFEGYQDTLYTHSLRQFYRDCDIYGTIDYIFGNAAVVLQNCNIYSRLPLDNQFNTLTAQGRTDPNQNTGTSIQNCTIKAAKDLASSNSSTKTYLGRPWKEYSVTVIMQSFIDSVIDPAGWSAWSGEFALSTLYYAEFNNTGPGSNTTNRVQWPGYHVISGTEAANFTVSNFIAGGFWLPGTGVPYVGGLQ
ncbi:pectinesterase-like [Populus trichocarpa]|uniref:pectinesterase-like n=1 Tax=Populus trichocarpa TaxID=3694 RepID=UPI002277B5B1|nr:pectinesterase-like [Populus trichocarpa]